MLSKIGIEQKLTALTIQIKLKKILHPEYQKKSLAQTN
jgi:hypothetical protein